MNPRRTRLLALAFVFASAAHAEIVIGVAGPMTGNLAVLGEGMQAGAARAVADINAAGGIGGETLRIEVVDDKCDAKTADAVANQLAGVGALMVAGHLCLGASMAAASVYAINKIVQISPGTTYAKYTDERPGPGTFRVSGRDDQQSVVAAALIADAFAGKRVAFIDDKSPYGKGLADSVRVLFNEAGGKEILNQAIDPGKKSYAQLVSVLKAAEVEVVYFGGYWPEAAAIAAGMQEQGMAAVLIVGDAVANDEFAETAGNATDGTLMTFMPDPRLDPANAPLIKAFRADGVEPDGYVLYTYAAVQAWAEAAKAAGSTAFDDVAAALSKGTFRTALGDLSFDGKGDAMTPGFVVYEWRDGNYDYRK